ncbi:MAG: bifunctional folylpolyglutamate synthase/dihydrofolate synthase, partial [Bacteroidota bacterium]
KADLNNTISICKFLGNPEKKFKSIHVAGTNGKGSSSHMLASILQKSGYKTGLYTSPHLLDFRERIKINGRMIPKKNIQAFVKKYRWKFEEISPSFFEWSVGLAFDYFANEKVDIAVIEVGLGGRLDSTNVIKPLVSLITNIGYDHTNLLGNTLDKIASEKAGIIKNNIPVVISELQKETEDVFRQKALNTKSKIYFAKDEFIPFAHSLNDKGAKVSVLQKSKSDFTQYQIDLPGLYQMKNISGVLQVIELLRKKGFSISAENIKTALSKVKKLTGLRGRFETLQKEPLVIADTGHNAEGLKIVLDLILKLKHNKLHIVFGVVEDKDPGNILKLLPKEKVKYYFTRATVPRSMESKKLKNIALNFGLKGKSFKEVNSAITNAMNTADKDDLIFIGGSTFVVADALHFKFKK